jgi:aspartyl-tRNA(Asn)/glutamyl-tRNA(Gln) amidotransferase subunit C
LKAGRGRRRGGQIDSPRRCPTARLDRTGWPHHRRGSTDGRHLREEVAHLARLSRLAVTDEELDRFAGQLDVILQAVARVGEVAAADIPPTSHSVPLTNVLREDVWCRAWTETRAGRRARTPPRTGSGCRGSWRRRPD